MDVFYPHQGRFLCGRCTTVYRRSAAAGLQSKPSTVSDLLLPSLARDSAQPSFHALVIPLGLLQHPSWLDSQSTLQPLHPESPTPPTPQTPSHTHISRSPCAGSTRLFVSNTKLCCSNLQATVQLRTSACDLHSVVSCHLALLSLQQAGYRSPPLLLLLLSKGGITSLQSDQHSHSLFSIINPKSVSSINISNHL